MNRSLSKSTRFLHQPLEDRLRVQRRPSFSWSRWCERTSAVDGGCRGHLIHINRFFWCLFEARKAPTEHMAQVDAYGFRCGALHSASSGRTVFLGPCLKGEREGSSKRYLDARFSFAMRNILPHLCSAGTHPVHTLFSIPSMRSFSFLGRMSPHVSGSR